MVLTGCSLLSKKPQTSDAPIVEPVPIRIVCPGPPKVDVLSLARVSPLSVMTEEEEILVGLSPEDYEKLSDNMQAILRTLKQKNSVIYYYRSCIDGYDKINSSGFSLTTDSIAGSR